VDGEGRTLTSEDSGTSKGRWAAGMKRKRYLCVIGTRPEAIKMAPVIRVLRQRRFRSVVGVCSTGQHRDLLLEPLRLFGIQPDYTLDLMTPEQSLNRLTARLFESLERVVRGFRPDCVLAQGDTTTAFAAALTAFYAKVPFGHVEAGLRTHDLTQPFPEEMNRRVADLVARFLFAPTESSRADLLREGHPAARIHVTGNTVVDALRHVAGLPYRWAGGPLRAVPRDAPLVLVTLHRRESFGKPMDRMWQTVRLLAGGEWGSRAHWVCPLHPNPEARGPARRRLAGLTNVSLLEPLDYLSLVNLMRRCRLILTDSGGIQEEAPYFGVPVLVLRNSTERPEGVAAGVAKLVGWSPRRIMRAAEAWLDDSRGDGRCERARGLYGDGHAATRIAKILQREL